MQLTILFVPSNAREKEGEKKEKGQYKRCHFVICFCSSLISPLLVLYMRLLKCIAWAKISQINPFWL